MASIPDQDTFYDMTDALEDQDMEQTAQGHQKRTGVPPELLHQIGLYDTMIKTEDALDSSSPDLIENIR